MVTYGHFCLRHLWTGPNLCPPDPLWTPYGPPTVWTPSGSGELILVELDDRVGLVVLEWDGLEWARVGLRRLSNLAFLPSLHC